MNDLELPTPDAAALATSAALAARIRDEIVARGGFMPFERYMARVLYEPGLGYYSAGSAKLGAYGDFVTAPELGPMLAEALAAQAADVLERVETPAMLELGAGTGRLAADLLDALDRRGLPPAEYRILEPSADLRQRQQTRLARFGARVAWLDAPPDPPFSGVIVANEVIDALPVARFVKQAGRAWPLGVGLDDERFVWRQGPEEPALAARVERIEQTLEQGLPDGYRSELCTMLGDWMRGLGNCLDRGAMLLVDYGLVRREYYHEQRSDGTLICHYRQRAHADPFLWPGLQDVSAWVDFSALADAAQSAGLEVAGFTTQGQFLLESLASLDAGALALDDPARQSALKTLVLPGEMGERFKVMLLVRDVQGSLPGRDFRDRL